jgi:hypothetical protein
MIDRHRCAVLDSTGADYIFIPEQPPKGDKWEDEMCEVLKAVSGGVVLGARSQSHTSNTLPGFEPPAPTRRKEKVDRHCRRGCVGQELEPDQGR